MNIKIMILLGFLSSFTIESSEQQLLLVGLQQLQQQRRRAYMSLHQKESGNSRLAAPSTIRAASNEQNIAAAQALRLQPRQEAEPVKQ